MEDMTKVVDELIEAKNEYIRLLEEKIIELENKLKKETK